MRKIFFIIITALIITVVQMPTIESTYAATDIPNIEAESGILINAETGEILYKKNMDSQLEPASTTKMITCLLALENLELDQVVTIDAETPFTEGSRIYLLEGEQITVGNILYGLMLESANDCAVAIAKEVAGSVEDFAIMMNERAKELGATNTNFINPNGLHIEGHVTTAHDLAMIAKGCMKNEKFREYVSTYKFDIPATNKQEQRHVYNTNRLIYDAKTKVTVKGVTRPTKYDGAIGIKTGYTSHAGGCLVAGANRDGTELIAVVLKSTDLGRFADCIALLDFGFANYHSYKAVSKDNEMDKIPIKMGKVRKIAVAPAKDCFITLPIEASTAVVTTKIIMKENLTAPVKKGEQVGVIKVFEAETQRQEIPVVATETVESGTILALLGVEDDNAKMIYLITAIILVILMNICLFFTWLRMYKNKKRRVLRERRAMEIALARKNKLREYEQRGWPY